MELDIDFQVEAANSPIAMSESQSKFLKTHNDIHSNALS